MAEKVPQTFANHTRWDTLFHFFLGPVFVLGVLLTIAGIFALGHPAADEAIDQHV